MSVCQINCWCWCCCCPFCASPILNRCGLKLPSYQPTKISKHATQMIAKSTNAQYRTGVTQCCVLFSNCHMNANCSKNNRHNIFIIYAACVDIISVSQYECAFSSHLFIYILLKRPASHPIKIIILQNAKIDLKQCWEKYCQFIVVWTCTLHTILENSY